MTANQVTQRSSKPRVRVFIDYWNFQLGLNEKESEATGQSDARFKIDWRNLPGWVAGKAAELARIAEFSYEGAIIFASYNPKTELSFKNWALTWLDRQPGIQVDLRERQPKAPPKCPSCHMQISRCPNCNGGMAGTVEKGVDTAIATDMIRLAWEDVYDLGVLVTSDSDLIPAVKFLDQKGRKIIQAGFPPKGMELATACWASLALFPLREEFRRPERTAAAL